MKKTIFYNTNPVAISTRLNEYMKSNFGYSVESDLASLREAKVTLEAQKRELRADHQDRAYVENMLMLETIKSLLKAHVAEGELPPGLKAYQDKKKGKAPKKGKAKSDKMPMDAGKDGKMGTKDDKPAFLKKDESVSEAEERPYICFHAKKGKHECHADSSYGAAKKAAAHWKLKSTAGITPKLADVEHVAESEKRWKQTSMSSAEATKKYGKENVKVKKGGLRNGDDMVEVFVEGYKIRDKDRGYGVADATYKTRKAAQDAAIMKAASNGGDWEVIEEKVATEGKYKSDAQRKAVHASKAEKTNEGDAPKFDTMKKYSNTYEAPKEYKMKKEKLEEGLMAQLNALLEADAADAEITMAARGIVDELQDMIEKLGKIQNDQLGPLADEMAYSHGPEQSAAFKQASDSAIAGLLGQARSTKDAVNDAVLVLMGDKPADDMAATGAELGGDMGADMEDDISMDMDLTGGDESMAGPEDEPLGRAKR